MLTVKTHLSPSSVHGIGLYASETIPAGSVIWKFNRHIDHVYSASTFMSMCLEVDNLLLQHLLNASYCRGGRYYYITDNARFINHSDNEYNIAFIDDTTEVATRSIKAGEELLENYLLSYDPVDFFFQELHNPDPQNYLQILLAQGGEVARA